MRPGFPSLASPPSHATRLSLSSLAPSYATRLSLSSLAPLLRDPAFPFSLFPLFSLFRPFRSRVIVKLSGEALQGGEAQCSVAPAFLRSLAEQLAAASSEHGVRVGVVVGGGNHLRGADAARGGAAAGLPRPDADGAGMLGTLLNGVLLRGALEVAGADATLLSALPVPGVAAAYDRRLALKAWDEGHVLVLAAGTGNPFFTTDTAAALRAADLGADAVLKATKVDGVYDKDPVRHPDSARRFERTSFRSLLNRDLRVLDATASAFCRENKLPLVVFNVQKPGGLLAALRGDADVGTVVLPSDDVLETFEGQVDEREETQADDAAETRQTEAAL